MLTSFGRSAVAWIGLAGFIAASPPDDPKIPRLVAARDTSFAPSEDVKAQLTLVGAIRVAADQSVYVADRRRLTVLHLDARGAALGSLGSQGEGPGEMLGFGSMGWHGDSLWVADPMLRRVTVYPERGAQVHTISYAMPLSDSDLQPGASRRVLANGAPPLAVVGEDAFLVAPGLGSIDFRSTDSPKTALLLVTRQFEILDTLARLPMGHTAMVFAWSTGEVMIPQPFGDDPMVAAASDGSLVVAVERTAATQPGSNSFTVRAFGPRGEVRYTRQLSYQPLSIPRVSVDSFMTNFFAGIPQSSRGLPVTRDSLTEHLFLPRYYPPVQTLIVGRDGTVWLKMRDAAASPGKAEWLVLGAHGFELARVQVPSDLAVLEAERGTIWGVEYDADDVPSLVRYVVRGAPSGL